MNENFMKEAIKEAYKGIKKRDGGPFGAVIVKDNTIIGKGHNQVLKNQDCTCHGEMMAIRNACKKQKKFSLKDAVIYTTAEPCPMCLGAILWSGIKDVYYGCSIKDTAKLGFNDEVFYKKLSLDSKKMKMKQICKEECIELFKTYNSGEKELY